MNTVSEAKICEIAGGKIEIKDYVQRRGARLFQEIGHGITTHFREFCSIGFAGGHIDTEIVGEEVTNGDIPGLPAISEIINELSTFSDFVVIVEF